LVPTATGLPGQAGQLPSCPQKTFLTIHEMLLLALSLLQLLVLLQPPSCREKLSCHREDLLFVQLLFFIRRTFVFISSKSDISRSEKGCMLSALVGVLVLVVGEQSTSERPSSKTSIASLMRGGGLYPCRSPWSEKFPMSGCSSIVDILACTAAAAGRGRASGEVGPFALVVRRRRQGPSLFSFSGGAGVGVGAIATE